MMLLKNTQYYKDLNDMKITADITPMKILNINMLAGNEMILLSIPMKDNVVDMNEEVLKMFVELNKLLLDVVIMVKQANKRSEEALSKVRELVDGVSNVITIDNQK